MKRSAIKLPRRQLFKLRGNSVEVAVGILAFAILESQADAATVNGEFDHLHTHSGQQNAATSKELHGALGHLADFQPDSLKTLSLDELKALLTPEALKSLGLDADFVQLLDTDAKKALRQLETAFRKKIEVVSHHTAMASAADHQHDSADHVANGEHHLSAGDALGHAIDFLGGVPFIIPLLGVAAAGGLVYAVAHDNGHDNHAPNAVNDAITTNENAAITFDPRSNDTDADGDSLTITQVNGTNITTTTPVTITNTTGATIGTVSIGSDGRLTFTPAKNYFGTPSFTYTVSDGNGGTSTATVNLTVNHVNQAPVAVADTFTTNENASVVINVVGNDTDVDGDKLTVTQVNGTAISTTQSVAITGGSLILNAAGNLVFTPTTNYSGTPSFTYTVSDGALTSTATVSGTVNFVNQAPTESLTAVRLAASAGVAIAVPAITVADVDSTSLKTTVTAAHGTFALGTVTGTGATVTGAGSNTLVLTGTQAQINASLAALQFTGTTGFTGADMLTVTTSDGALSTSATIALTIGQVASGFVQDGYISGATVFFDANGNGVLDAGEAIGVTDATGRYVITSNGPLTGNLIAFGGVNIDTGLANQAILTAPAGSSVVNPLTTLVTLALAANPSFTLQQASDAVSKALGLPAGTDYTHYDFLAHADALSLAVNKSAVQIITFINSVITQGGTASAAINAIGAMSSNGGTVDLTSTSIVTKLFVMAGLSQTAAAAAATSVVSINTAIAAATSIGGITQTVHDLNQAGVNLAPVAGADSATTTSGHAVTIDVLANDKDPEGGKLVVKAVNGLEISPIAFGGQAIAVTGGFVTLGTDGKLVFTPNAGFTGTPTFTYSVADDHNNVSTGLVTVTVAADTTPANVAPVAANDSAHAALSTPVTIDVLANDTDANHDTLTVTQVNGQALGTAPITVSGGTVASDGNGHLIFTPNVGTVGNSSFTYTANDGHGGTSTATVTVDTEPTSSVYHIDATALPAVVAHAADLGAHGVTTVDLNGTGVATITDADAQTLIAGGLHFAADDHVSLAGTAGHTHLTTTLKGLADLEVSAVGFAGGVTNVSIDAGTGDLGGLSHSALPTFDPALHVTLDIAGGVLDKSIDLGAVATTFAHDGIDALGVAGNGALTINATQAEGFATSGMTFDPAANITVAATAAELPMLADAHLAGLNIDTIDVSGNAVITDAEAANLIQSGIHFAAGDHVTVDATAGHTHLSTTLKGLADLEVSAVAFAGAGAGVNISLDAGTGDLGGLAHGALPTFDPALHVTLDINPGTLDHSVDLGAIATTFAHDGIDAIGVLGNGSLTIDATQAEGFATSGLTFDPAANVTVTATAAELPTLADAHLAGLNIDTIDVAGAATITDAEASNLVGAGIHFAAGDNVTVNATAGHTHLSTTLKGLADLEVSAVGFAGVGAVNISLDAGTADLGGLAHGALPHFDDALHVTLDLVPGQLDSNLDLGAVATTMAHDGIDALGVQGNGDLEINVAQVEGFATSGLTFDPAANVTVNATAANIGELADHASSLAGLHIDQIDVSGSATITDQEASNLVNAGLHFANGDTVAVVGSAGHTHLSTTLKGLQDLEVTAVAFAGAVSSISIDAGTGDLGSLAHGALPHFDSALHVTLDIDPTQLSSSVDLGSVGAAFHAAGIDSIGVAGGGTLSLTVAQAESFAVSGLTFDPATNVTINASAAEAVVLADNPFVLHGLNVDQIHVTAPAAITDVEAVNLIEAGLHFATGDHVTLAVANTNSIGGANSTHLSTSLKGLHDLNVDSVAAATGVGHIELYAGDLHNLQVSDIPTFTGTSSAPVDVMLKVDVSEASDVARLAHALATAGVDHIQFNGAFSSLSTTDQQALTNALAANTNLTITYDGHFSGATAVAEVAPGDTLTAADTALVQSSIYRDLLTSFETSSDTHGHGGVMQLADGATSSLAEAGMLRAYTAETLIVDGTTSGDHLLTTLKDIADIGADVVKLAAQTSSAPVYIDLGATGTSDIQTLFKNLDLDGHATGTGSIFSGNHAVALVLDADAANALSHTDGAMSHLASLGFTEVDVLATPGASAPAFSNTAGLQVKVINADDPLYHHLHPATGG